MNSLTPHNCAQCGSSLILVSTITEKLEGNLFPQTTTTFRCEDVICQDSLDKETRKRLEVKKERDIKVQQKQHKRSKISH